MMSNPKSILLTASELGYLWTGYSINEMSKWYLKIFREHSIKDDVKNLFAFALQNTNEMLVDRAEILSNDGYAIPVGFSHTDIDVSSTPLFSDRFMLFYLHVGSKLGLNFHSRSLALSTRVDVRKYNTECLNFATVIHERVVDLILNKGFYMKTPALPTQTFPEYIQKSSYLNGWLGDTRPMNSMEIANHYLIIEILLMVETLASGFAQTSDSEEIVEILQKGVTVANKQYHAMVEFLEKEELPIPTSYSAEITDSKKRVFSDRIMVTHLTGLFGSLLSQYGFSLGTVMNHNLVTAYTTQISKTGAFTEKLSRFLIEKEWLEKVPGARSKT
ncbi:MAG: hypothetical protein K0Q87_3234 [Neobacillus sp.]|nr:hypothetical protein [Neobacillus sp.]